LASPKKAKAKSKTKKQSTGSRCVPIIKKIWHFSCLIAKSKVFMESTGIALIAFSVFLIISIATFQSADGHTFSQCGKLGTRIAAFLIRNFGYSTLFIPFVIIIKGVLQFRKRLIENQTLKLIGLTMFLLSTSSCFSLMFAAEQSWHNYTFSPGGKIGQFLATPVIDLLGNFGSGTLFISAILISALIITDVSYHDLLRGLNRLFRHIAGSFHFRCKEFFINFKERRIARKAMKKERNEMKKQELKEELMKQEVMEPDIHDTTQYLEEEYPEESFGETSPGVEVNGATQPVIFIENEPPQYVEEETHAPVPIKDTGRPMEFLKTRSAHFNLPTLDILARPSDSSDKESREHLIQKSDMLLSKLKEFNIDGRVTEVCPGPVITRYEFEPAPGIKISKIMGLSDDLAMGMRSRFGLRIVPMPGKSTLGVEIPNKRRETVYLKDILLSDEFQIAKKKSILTLPLGKDTAGNPFISDLKKMPHLLIAGATGSGKSVCINTILAGLLFIAKPEQVRLLLIDPKMLELSDFNGIPHLREPVITDTKQAPDALGWAVSEMERRYRLLAETGVRNIDQFNQKVDAPDYEGELEHLPYLVIVIDELADLMITAASAVEESIQRLAQMARAAGIHLIIATQRPSVDVITGVIKANLPCRLAFQVASRIDSRTIIDSTGAEKLLGMGDCMFIPPGTSQLMRAHGAFVSEKEVKELVSYLTIQPGTGEEESIFKSLPTTGNEVDEVEDELYNRAVKLVLSSGLASISMLQRRLKVGHSRASRLIDYMELTGIVGPHIGSKPREILVDRDEYLERIQEIEESGVYEQ